MSTLKVNAIEPYSGGTVTITGASIESASYAETANTLTAGDKTINGNVTVNGNENLNGNLIQDQAGTNAVLHLQNPNFYSEYHGNTLQWFPNSGLGGNAILTVAEKAEAVLQANAFSGSYDNVVTIKTNQNGVQFADWDLPSYGDNIWLQIPDQGTPSFKRGLDIQGAPLTLPGLGDYVDDAAAATGGVPVNGVYRTGSTLKIRVS